MKSNAHQRQQAKVSKQRKKGGDKIFEPGNAPERSGSHDGDQQALSMNWADFAHTGGQSLKAGKSRAKHATEQQQGVEDAQNRMDS